MARIQVEDSPAIVAEWAASALRDDLVAAVAEHGRAHWVAAGGSTPAAAYRVLAERCADEIPWNHLRILMGDERCVPVEHPDSNWGQLRAALLEFISVRDDVLLRPRAELGAEPAAELYETILRGLATSSDGRVRLDHVWLGMGEDGHTLSLFPGRLVAAAEDRLVAPVHDSPKPPPDRVTLTLEALKGAVHCVILATGAGKREVVARAVSGDIALPIARAAQTVESAGGKVTWALDRAAAGPHIRATDPHLAY
jgi:6-phosphogluconolactonase